MALTLVLAVMGVGLAWVYRLKQKAAELESRLREAEAANLAKGAFLANMSHEIRTPMNAILGLTRLLQDGPLASEQRELVEVIRNSTEGLSGIVNDVLDFSKIEAGKLTVDPIIFNLDDALGDLLKLVAPRARAKNLELICHN